VEIVLGVAVILIDRDLPKMLIHKTFVIFDVDSCVCGTAASKQDIATWCAKYSGYFFFIVKMNDIRFLLADDPIMDKMESSTLSMHHE